MQPVVERIVTTLPKRAALVDASIAVIFGVLAVVEGLFVLDGNRAVLVASGVIASSALAWRRTNPALSAIVAVSALSVGPALGEPVDEMFTVFVPVMVCVFSLSLHGPTEVFRRAIAVITVLALGSVIVAGKGIDDAFYVGIVLGFAVVPAWLLRRRLFEVADMTQRAVRAEIDAADRAELARLEERNRLACELHDIIGHSVSLMVVHAAAAESHIADEGVARASLGAIQDVGRQAVADLARSLGLLRGDHVEIGLAPPSGLDDIEDLVRQAQRGGDVVSFDLLGDAAQIPPTLGLTVYRIVQEALTNARRYAPGAPVCVSVRVNHRTVLVDVVNEPVQPGAPAPAVTTSGSGHGIAGLRERVRIFGGTLSVGPSDEGGFELHASIPFEATDR